MKKYWAVLHDPASGWYILVNADKVDWVFADDTGMKVVCMMVHGDCDPSRKHLDMALAQL